MLDFIEDSASVLDTLGYDEAIAQFFAVRRAVNLAEHPAALTQEETILRFLVYANPALLAKAHSAIDAFQARCEKLFGSREDWGARPISEAERIARLFREHAA
ncbi:MAG: hypothetical protein MUC89_15550 [Acetobacteraceae bacterium]|nr:hypothetical protein [Acetobacteraceae bacterium]